MGKEKIENSWGKHCFEEEFWDGIPYGRSCRRDDGWIDWNILRVPIQIIQFDPNDGLNEWMLLRLLHGYRRSDEERRNEQ